MPHRVIIVGTDTGVGKTTIATALLHRAQRHFATCRVLKPVETGCTPTPLDGEALKTASADPRPLEEIVPFRFAKPVAPAAAGSIQIERIIEAYREVSTADFCLVEGAGGLLVPFTAELLFADLVETLHHTAPAAVLLVARNSLGTINHTLLTLAELKRRRIPVAGVVLNNLTPTLGPDADDNRKLIAAHTDVHIWSAFPYGATELPAWDLSAIGLSP